MGLTVVEHAFDAHSETPSIFDKKRGSRVLIWCLIVTVTPNLCPCGENNSALLLLVGPLIPDCAVECR